MIYGESEITTKVECVDVTIKSQVVCWIRGLCLFDPPGSDFILLWLKSEIHPMMSDFRESNDSGWPTHVGWFSKKKGSNPNQS